MASDPITSPQDDDVFLVGGKPNPGLAKIAGWKRVYGWEVKKGKGVKGSTLTLNEYPPAEGTATVYLWLPEHFAQWEAFRPLLKYDATKKTVTAIDFYHPTTAEIEVSSVVCKDIGARVHDGKGLYSYALSFIEYNPPALTPAVSTPGGSKGSADKKGASKGSGDPALDARQAETKRLTEEAKRL